MDQEEKDEEEEKEICADTAVDLKRILQNDGRVSGI